MFFSGILVDSLFDIGRKMNLITGRKKDFYEDKKGMGECRSSEETDDEFEQERQTQIGQQRKEEQLPSKEESFINKVTEMLELNEQTSSVVLVNSSLNRSNLSRDTTQYIEQFTQTESDNQHQPKIRKIRDCTDANKSTCVNVSMNCNLSAKMSRGAAQSVCKTLYNHNYYLSKEEAIENDPSLALHKEQDLSPKPGKHQKPNMLKKKAPSSQEQYRAYENVLRTAKTISDFNLNMAIQNEKDAALAFRKHEDLG